VSTQMKGIELVRRDWSLLSKNALQYCVDQILHSETTLDNCRMSILDQMKKISEEIREYPTEEFIISKEISKDPSEYPDIRQLPHVIIAKRLKEKKVNIKVKDRIPYLICVYKNDELKNKSNITDRAFHPSEYEERKDELEIDYQYYLSSQVFPPVLRICKHIEGKIKKMKKGINSQVLSEYLGIKSTSQYYNSTNNYDHDKDMRFQYLYNFGYLKEKMNIQKFKCKNCDSELSFDFEKKIINIIENEEENRSKLLTCENCEEEIEVYLIENWIQGNYRNLLKKYYEGKPFKNEIKGWIKNKDERSKVFSIDGSILIEEKKSEGKMEYSNFDLFEDLEYFLSLFNLKLIISKINKDYKEKKNKLVSNITLSKNLESIQNENLEFFELFEKVNNLFKKSSFRIVNLTKLFSIYNE
jgi:DNA polymerase alpha subunit A